MRVEKVCNIFDFYLHYKAKNDFKEKFIINIHIIDYML